MVNMISSWRKKRAARQANKKQDFDDFSGMELTIPNHYRCPISLDLMKDPVTLSTGITYDRHSIETWIEAGNKTCPITNQVLNGLEPIPNHTIRKMIQNWCVDNSSYGVERIPTPRIPASSHQIAEILSKIVTARRQEDASACQEMVAKIKGLAKESERNRRCVVANGTGNVLASTFDAFANVPFDKNVVALEEILSALAIMSPLDVESKSFLGATSSLKCLLWFLKSGDLSVRTNAILVLKSVLSSDQQKLDEFLEIEGSLDALVKLIKEPISSATTKASLLIVYHMVSNNKGDNENVVKQLVEMRLVERLLEMVVDSEKNVIEKALGILSKICTQSIGRDQLSANALTMPVLVKKILRVSNLATEFSVSIMWMLCKNVETKDGGGVIVEALQVGAFQKLLLLLQFGCSERIKEKATDLLKILNSHRDKLECIDSMDFKNLKRPA